MTGPAYDPNDPITHVSRAIRLLQAFAPDALPAKPVPPPVWSGTNTIGPERKALFHVPCMMLSRTHTRGLVRHQPERYSTFFIKLPGGHRKARRNKSGTNSRTPWPSAILWVVLWR